MTEPSAEQPVEPDAETPPPEPDTESSESTPPEPEPGPDDPTTPEETEDSSNLATLDLASMIRQQQTLELLVEKSEFASLTPATRLQAIRDAVTEQGQQLRSAFQIELSSPEWHKVRLREEIEQKYASTEAVTVVSSETTIKVSAKTAKTNSTPIVKAKVVARPDTAKSEAEPVKAAATPAPTQKPRKVLKARLVSSSKSAKVQGAAAAAATPGSSRSQQQTGDRERARARSTASNSTRASSATSAGSNKAEPVSEGMSAETQVNWGLILGAILVVGGSLPLAFSILTSSSAVTKVWAFCGVTLGLVGFAEAFARFLDSHRASKVLSGTTLFLIPLNFLAIASVGIAPISMITLSVLLAFLAVIGARRLGVPDTLMPAGIVCFGLLHFTSLLGLPVYMLLGMSAVLYLFLMTDQLKAMGRLSVEDWEQQLVPRMTSVIAMTFASVIVCGRFLIQELDPLAVVNLCVYGLLLVALGRSIADRNSEENRLLAFATTRFGEIFLFVATLYAGRTPLASAALAATFCTLQILTRMGYESAVFKPFNNWLTAGGTILSGIAGVVLLSSAQPGLAAVALLLHATSLLLAENRVATVFGVLLIYFGFSKLTWVLFGKSLRPTILMAKINASMIMAALTYYALNVLETKFKREDGFHSTVLSLSFVLASLCATTLSLGLVFSGKAEFETLPAVLKWLVHFGPAGLAVVNLFESRRLQSSLHAYVSFALFHAGFGILAKNAIHWPVLGGLAQFWPCAFVAIALAVRLGADQLLKLDSMWKVTLEAYREAALATPMIGLAAFIDRFPQSTTINMLVISAFYTFEALRMSGERSSERSGVWVAADLFLFLGLVSGLKELNTVILCSAWFLASRFVIAWTLEFHGPNRSFSPLQAASSLGLALVFAGTSIREGNTVVGLYLSSAACLGAFVLPNIALQICANMLLYLATVKFGHYFFIPSKNVAAKIFGAMSIVASASALQAALGFLNPLTGVSWDMHKKVCRVFAQLGLNMAALIVTTTCFQFAYWNRLPEFGSCLPALVIPGLAFVIAVFGYRKRVHPAYPHIVFINTLAIALNSFLLYCEFGGQREWLHYWALLLILVAGCLRHGALLLEKDPPTKPESDKAEGSEEAKAGSKSKVEESAWMTLKEAFSLDLMICLPALCAACAWFGSGREIFGAFYATSILYFLEGYLRRTSKNYHAPMLFAVPAMLIAIILSGDWTYLLCGIALAVQAVMTVLAKRKEESQRWGTEANTLNAFVALIGIIFSGFIPVTESAVVSAGLMVGAIVSGGTLLHLFVGNLASCVVAYRCATLFYGPTRGEIIRVVRVCWILALNASFQGIVGYVLDRWEDWKDTSKVWSISCAVTSAAAALVLSSIAVSRMDSGGIPMVFSVEVSSLILLIAAFWFCLNQRHLSSGLGAIGLVVFTEGAVLVHGIMAKQTFVGGLCHRQWPLIIVVLAGAFRLIAALIKPEHLKEFATMVSGTARVTLAAPLLFGWTGGQVAYGRCFIATSIFVAVEGWIKKSVDYFFIAGGLGFFGMLLIADVSPGAYPYLYVAPFSFALIGLGMQTERFGEDTCKGLQTAGVLLWFFTLGISMLKDDHLRLAEALVLAVTALAGAISSIVTNRRSLVYLSSSVLALDMVLTLIWLADNEAWAWWLSIVFLGLVTIGGFAAAEKFLPKKEESNGDSSNSPTSPTGSSETSAEPPVQKKTESSNNSLGIQIKNKDGRPHDPPPESDSQD